MTEEIEIFDKNVVRSNNTSNIVDECDYDNLDSKICVWEIASNDQMKQYDAPMDSIKTEVSLVELHNEDVIQNENTGANIKIEIKKELLFCEHCNEEYQDYCTKCGMLVCILNRCVLNDTDNRAIQEIPKAILEIKEIFGEFGIFALKVIPKGVRFGPFSEVNSSEYSRKMMDGRIINSDDRSKCLNWMQLIRAARSIFKENLRAFRCDENLYFYSVCEIQVGVELLVYFGEECKDSVHGDVKMDIIPQIENKEVFACIFCCFGFSSKVYLAQHKTICPDKVNERFSVEELTQCQFCKIYLGKNEYLKYHKTYCETANRKNIKVARDNRAAEMKKQKTQRRQIYACSQCKYKTIYKSDLKSHTNKHYEVKIYKCGTCGRHFKTLESLKVHLESTHMEIEEQEILNLSTNDNLNKDEVKPFKCVLCEFRTRNKRYLKVHAKAIHLKEYNHKCVLCEYKALHRTSLRRHIIRAHTNEKVHKTVDLKKFIFKCAACEYKTYNKARLKSHFRTKHLRELRYVCEVCNYKTDRRPRLEVHIKAKHLEEFNYKCESCSYATFEKAYLKSHIKTVHLKEYSHKCESCDFKTNVKFNLKEHIKTKHLQEFDYNCTDCEYRTNHKSHFTLHIKRKHTEQHSPQDEVKRYKCSECDFQTKYGYHLTKHVKTKHLKEVEYKCEECKYVTYHKPYLDKHINSKHLKVFKYKCSSCEYVTNDKPCLNKHTKAKHLDVCSHKCMSCDFQTNTKQSLRNHVRAKHLDTAISYGEYKKKAS